MKLRILFGFATAAVLWGQAQPVPGDAPGRVGRLSYVYGSVSFRPESVEEWAAAALNAPLTDGDHLWTDAGAQAEVQVGLTTIHLAPETGFFVVRLTDSVFRMALAEGALNIRIPRMDEGETVEVETPHGLFKLLQTGSYRVDVRPEADYAALIVRSGAGAAIAGGQTFLVDAGKRVVLSGKPATVELLDAPAPDPWDEWCAGRDEAAERNFEVSQHYVSWEISGAADFATYGDWVEDGDYGWCWRPRLLPAGWAPFRFGHWIWKTPWGWTWVDEAPWGFAPSHWGRWTRLKGMWAWVPQRPLRHPKYEPAAVAFSATRNSRFVSWVPLAPGETVDGRPRQYRNRDAVTAVTQEHFAVARPVAPSRLLVIDRGATEFVERKPEIMPAREGILGGQVRAGNVAGRKEPEPARAVPERAQPAATEPPRIEQQRRTEPEIFEGPQRIETPRRVAPVVVDESREEEARRAAERRREEEARRTEEHRQAEERRRADDDRRAEESHRAGEERRNEEARRAEEHRRAEESRRADESRRAEEQRQRQAEEQRRAEESRRQEEHRRAEESRRADEQRRAEESRRAEEGRRADEQRRADESRRQEEHRRADESRRAEENRANEARKK